MNVRVEVVAVADRSERATCPALARYFSVNPGAFVSD
jgi:hypothetical protein